MSVEDLFQTCIEKQNSWYGCSNVRPQKYSIKAIRECRKKCTGTVGLCIGTWKKCKRMHWTMQDSVMQATGGGGVVRGSVSVGWIYQLLSIKVYLVRGRSLTADLCFGRHKCMEWSPEIFMLMNCYYSLFTSGCGSTRVIANSHRVLEIE